MLQRFIQTLHKIHTRACANVKKRIFFWKKGLFFYNQRMSNFKTHKISTVKKPQKSTQEKTTTATIPQKKGSNIKKWIVGILITMASILFVGTIALRAITNMSISEWNTDQVFVPTIITGTGVIQKVSGTKNILIAWVGGAWHEWSYLTDSIMLASINSDEESITLLSIPRDLYVAYPKWFGTSWRINALYSIGKSNKVGIKLLAEKVSEITGQPIDGYAVIDFTWFRYIVNALGWVEVDVPRNLYDNEYPNNNWWYEVFSVKAGLQTMNGDTALKYARSRHSTSDFDRSERQQLIIKAIKDKALSLWFLTSPTKINEVLTAIRAHIDTNMTVGEAAELAMRVKDINTENITIYNLNNDCVGTNCTAWAYLYTPSREYFGWSAVLIPENASISKLSYYEDIRRFSGFIFHFPEIRNQKYPISIIAGKWKSSQARTLMGTLGKLGITLDGKKSLVESTGSIANSHINIYWNSEMTVGIPESSTIVQALKFLEEKIPYNTVLRNEYIVTEWPRIEIVIGNDIASYFTFAKPSYYLPYLAPSATGATWSDSIPVASWEKKILNTKTIPQKASTSTNEVPEKLEESILIAPGEWEEF